MRATFSADGARRELPADRPPGGAGGARGGARRRGRRAPVAGVRRRRIGRRQDAAAGRADAPGRARAARSCWPARRVDFGGESELPYLPLVAALRPLARSGDPALTEPLREAVAPLLPGLGAPARRAGGDQARLFEGLLSLLDALGRERPVLLVIEDLHWADRSTRAALAFLARSLTDERVLVVGSYRPDELRPRHPLRPLLAELERDPRARRVALEPLTPRGARRAAGRHPRRAARRRAAGARCGRARAATRCSARSCWPPGSTAAAPRRTRCATR